MYVDVTVPAWATSAMKLADGSKNPRSKLVACAARRNIRVDATSVALFGRSKEVKKDNKRKDNIKIKIKKRGDVLAKLGPAATEAQKIVG